MFDPSELRDPNNGRWIADFLAELTGAGLDREKFMEVFGRLHASKLTNAQLLEVAAKYGYGGAPMDKTRAGILRHIGTNFTHAARFQSKIAGSAETSATIQNLGKKLNYYG
jgi:hypothetical protein